MHQLFLAADRQLAPLHHTRHPSARGFHATHRSPELRQGHPLQRNPAVPSCPATYKQIVCITGSALFHIWLGIIGVSAGISGVFSYPLTPRGPVAPWSPLGPRFPRHGPGTPLPQIHLPSSVSLSVFDAVSTQTAVTQAAPLSALPIEPRGARRSIAARAPPSPSIALTTLRAGGASDAAHSVHVSTAQTLACVWPRSQERFDSSLCALLPTLARHPLLALSARIAVRAFHTLRASWPGDSCRPATNNAKTTVRSAACTYGAARVQAALKDG